MKKTLLLTCITVITFSLQGQIESFKGIIEMDACNLDADETACGYIQLDTLNFDLWQIGTPQKPFFDSAYNPPNAILTDTIYPYDTSRLEFFEFNVPISEHPYYQGNIIVGFKHKFETDTLVDGGFIEASFDGGVSWHNVIFPENSGEWLEYFGTENMYSIEDTLANGKHGFSGTSDGWIHSKIQWVWQLPVVRSMQIPPDTLRLRFFYMSDSLQTNKDGWMIDDIRLEFADLGSAVEEQSTLLKTNLTPNPFSGSATLYFNNPNKGPLHLSIVNLSGKIMQQVNDINDNEILIRQDQLTSGLYFYYLKNKKGITLGAGKMIVE
jgi:hypothetical protein